MGGRLQNTNQACAETRESPNKHNKLRKENMIHL